MANTTEDCINQMSREDFFQYAVTGLKARGKCGRFQCKECALDYSYFRKRFGIGDFDGDNCCSSIIGYIGKRFEKELAAPKLPEPQECTVERTAECRGCKHCKEVGGVLFCEMWHNTTVPEAFCCYHEPTEPIIINDIPGIELGTVKVDGMSVDEWIDKELQTGGVVDELPF